MICREKTACFTGHRQLKEPYEVLFLKTRREVEGLIQRGYIYFAAGGARGFDALAADVVLKLKEKYPYIYLILVLPFFNQYVKEKGWSREEIERYERHKKYASQVVYTQEAYSSGCYYKRDRCLVDISSVCIAYQYKNTGGTAYTANYALKQGAEVIRLTCK